MNEGLGSSNFEENARANRQAVHKIKANGGVTPLQREGHIRRLEAGATGARRPNDSVAPIENAAADRRSPEAKPQGGGNVVWHEQGCSFTADANPSAKPNATAIPGGDRRKRRRALISAPIRVRAVDVTRGGPDEVSTTLDVSRNGVLFVTTLRDFSAGMEVAVTFPYTKSPHIPLAEQHGRVLRVHEMRDGRRSVAVALGVAAEQVVDAGGRTMISKGVKAVEPPRAVAKAPLVLVVDADLSMREALKAQLVEEGYNVFAVSCTGEAREILKMFTPALVISEIEGADLPGLEVCAFCKTTPRLRNVPVMLMTSSAYPSDYANAHSLGAVVCMAKPYRPERLAHVVRLLAPTQEHKEREANVRPIDPARGRKRPVPIAPPDLTPKRSRWTF